jgi:hypothetical protein
MKFLAYLLSFFILSSAFFWAQTEDPSTEKEAKQAVESFKQAEQCYEKHQYQQALAYLAQIPKNASVFEQARTLKEKIFKESLFKEIQELYRAGEDKEALRVSEELFGYALESFKKGKNLEALSLLSKFQKHWAIAPQVQALKTQIFQEELLKEIQTLYEEKNTMEALRISEELFEQALNSHRNQQNRDAINLLNRFKSTWEIFPKAKTLKHKIFYQELLKEVQSSYQEGNASEALRLLGELPPAEDYQTFLSTLQKIEDSFSKALLSADELQSLTQKIQKVATEYNALQDLKFRQKGSLPAEQARKGAEEILKQEQDPENFYYQYAQALLNSLR